MADATEPVPNGYLLTVSCPRGVEFMRWVGPTEAVTSSPDSTSSRTPS